MKFQAPELAGVELSYIPYRDSYFIGHDISYKGIKSSVLFDLVLLLREVKVHSPKIARTLAEALGYGESSEVIEY